MADIRVLPCDEGVATIILDRSHKRNALSVALREEVIDALEDLRSDDSVAASW